VYRLVAAARAQHLSAARHREGRLGARQQGHDPRARRDADCVWTGDWAPSRSPGSARSLTAPERGLLPSIDVADALLDERLAHRCRPDENPAIGGQRRPINYVALGLTNC